MQVYQQFDVDIATSLQLHQKRDSGEGVFLRLLRIFSACNFTKNENPA